MDKGKMISAALALGLVSALGACSTISAIETNLASPTTTQAAQNVGQFVKAFTCGLSAAAAAAQGVAVQPVDTAGNDVVDARGRAIIGVVYASSAAACQLLGGVITSTTPVSVPSTAVVK